MYILKNSTIFNTLILQILLNHEIHKTFPWNISDIDYLRGIRESNQQQNCISNTDVIYDCKPEIVLLQYQLDTAIKGLLSVDLK